MSQAVTGPSSGATGWTWLYSTTPSAPTPVVPNDYSLNQLGYQYAFQQNDFNGAATISLILLVVALLLAEPVGVGRLVPPRESAERGGGHRRRSVSRRRRPPYREGATTARGSPGRSG
ncbi:hypothetical protein [Streptomyces sp. LN325]|uniref:hypothetical protein n=1 Tax=Streptomyces sp. LN325 TaxID=3112976 RepID=UPI00371E28EA